MSICAETQGRFALDPDSGEPNGNCVFARLIQTGYTSSSLASADEKDALSTDFLYRAAYPNTDPSQVINKMQHDCLKLVAVVRKCKFKISATTADDVINRMAKARLTRLLSTRKSAISNFNIRKKPTRP